MNTDRFTDSIRRKLESIRPEFTEKDWTRMQASLQSGVPQPGSATPGQPFSGIWTAKPWLLAAATISTVVLVAVGMWQRREINHLRQTISQLSKHPTHQTIPGQSTPVMPKAGTPALTSSEKTQPQENQESTTSSAPKATAPLQRDTVYITQYAVSPSRSVPSKEERPVERSEVPIEQRYATTYRGPVSKDQFTQLNKSIHNSKKDTYGVPSTPSTVVNKSAANSLTVPTIQLATPFTKERGIQGKYAQNQQPKNKNISPINSIGNPANNSTGMSPSLPEPPIQSTGTLANYEGVNSLPISTQTVNWQSALAQRAKQMRPALATTVIHQAVEQIQTPASQPVQRITTRFRAGAGGEIASHVLSFGVFTELLLGPHLTLGVGLSQATYTGKFINDYDFDVRTRRDFRKEFARGIDPRRDILNIDTRTTRLQIPISLGYRIPLTQTLTLLPTLGTYLNLNSTETAVFYCPVAIPQRGFDEHNSDTSPSVELINTLAFGAGLEWQRGHWVVQGIPVLTLPMQGGSKPFQPEPNWQNNTTVGLRARLLYQF